MYIFINYFWEVKYRPHKYKTNNKSTEIPVTEHHINNCCDFAKCIFTPHQVFYKIVDLVIIHRGLKR